MEPAPVVEPEMLDRLVTLLSAAARDGGWHQPHRLVFVQSPDGEGFDLGVKELDDGDHPMEHLLGFVAPDEWYALGVVSFGWASPMSHDDSGYRTTIRPSLHPERVRVRSVFLAARDGSEASTTELADGRVLDTPGEGTIADAVRRALALPTKPAEEPLNALMTSMWLEQALIAAEEWWEEARENGGRGARGRRSGPDWSDLASLHPVLARARARGVRTPSSRLDDVGRLFAENIGWADVRWESITGAAPWGIEVEPDLAAWMDEGMYARWLLAEHPSVDALAERLRALVSRDCVRKLDACLEAWGLLARG
ncbi:MAG TPA: hypothetical protein VHN98_05860 [Acidimicrobiales bacterium]|nr:hypothetical protein [Acidimicrobiales bacterium]